MTRITPFLWFDTQAEDAANFYCSVFRNSKITETMPGPQGRPLTVSFELDGNEFVALNGGPRVRFNEATSFVITCKDQAEIDYYWSKLTSGGGAESMCGWLTDKYGLSWQAVPESLSELLRSPAAMQAMMKMRKFDIAALKAAA
jgi:predicted 3-demethylubiquinone-9 3-methyltransferase (glyoxalase superfamily)